MTDKPEVLLLTVPQVMDRLQVGKHAVYELIRTRKLISVSIGRCRRIPITALDSYLDSIMGEVR